MRPLAQAHGGAGAGILQPANRVDPRASRVDAHPRAHRDVVPVDADLGTDDLPAGRAQRDDRRVVEHGRTGFCGGAHVRQAQAGVVRPGVRVQGTRAKPVESERRNHLPGPLGIDEPVQPRPGERGVEKDPALHERRPVRASFVQRQEERDPVHEMRGNELRERAPLVVCFAHEAHVPETEIAEPTVDELRGRVRGPSAEVARVHERDGEAGAGGMCRDAGSDDARRRRRVRRTAGSRARRSRGRASSRIPS